VTRPDLKVCPDTTDSLDAKELAGPVERRTGVSRMVALFGAVALLGLLGGCAAPESDSAGVPVVAADDDGYAGTAIDPPFALPAVTLSDTAGEPFTLSTDLTAPVSLVFFGYSSCPDVCSTVLADAAAAIRRLPDATREQTQLIFITTDPARDTPAVIRAYLDQFNPDFVGLTGEVAQIQEAADALKVAYTPPTPAPGGYEVDHGTQVTGFGPPGAPGIIWTAGTTVGDLRADITRLAEDG
jgi:protein SCO1/2